MTDWSRGEWTWDAEWCWTGAPVILVKPTINTVFDIYYEIHRKLLSFEQFVRSFKSFLPCHSFQSTTLRLCVVSPWCFQPFQAAQNMRKDSTKVARLRHYAQRHRWTLGYLGRRQRRTLDRWKKSKTAWSTACVWKSPCSIPVKWVSQCGKINENHL